MREVYQLWLEAGRDVTAPPFATSVFASDAGDPFYDPPEDVLVRMMEGEKESARPSPVFVLFFHLRRS